MQGKSYSLLILLSDNDKCLSYIRFYDLRSWGVTPLSTAKIPLRCVDGIYLVDVDMKGGGAGLNWGEARSFLIAYL